MDSNQHHAAFWGRTQPLSYSSIGVDGEIRNPDQLLRRQLPCIVFLSQKDMTINTLKACLPKATEIVKEPDITIDGITTLVINHISDEPVTLYFRNEAEFAINTYTSENAQFLHNLYAHIEAIMGNLRRSSR